MGGLSDPPGTDVSFKGRRNNKGINLKLLKVRGLRDLYWGGHTSSYQLVVFLHSQIVVAMVTVAHADAGTRTPPPPQRRVRTVEA